MLYLWIMSNTSSSGITRLIFFSGTLKKIEIKSNKYNWQWYVSHKYCIFHKTKVEKAICTYPWYMVVSWCNYLQFYVKLSYYGLVIDKCCCNYRLISYMLISLLYLSISISIYLSIYLSTAIWSRYFTCKFKYNTLSLIQ